MSERENIFVLFLKLLKVRHTKEFSNQYFNEHPHKYNLYGLSKMLSEYGVENAAIRIVDKRKHIMEIQTPFIAHFSGEFAIVQKTTREEVSFLWKGNHHVLSNTKFIEAWSGVALLADSSPTSTEPDYKGHRKTEILNSLKKGLLAATLVFILLLTYLNQSLFNNVGVSLLLFINFIGIFICWLLLLKEMKIQNQYSDKICSLFKQSNCNSILESSAAKLFGIIGWAEVGLGYFLANIITSLFAPAMINYIALINVITLPYAFWSIWYQYKKAKQWCPLCLIVQVLLWAIFVINYFWGYIYIPEYTSRTLLTMMIMGSGYVASILSISMLAQKINTDKTIQRVRQSINSIKADEDIFAILLKKQPFYEIDFTSIIRFGNPESPLQLTILSNPYCNPCSRMHKRIEELLHKTNGIGVQYILSSFKEEWNITNKYLIAACLSGDSGSIMQIFTDWFERGKELRDSYFTTMSLDIKNSEVETEFQKHQSWRKKSQIRATPTILVNGYKMPDNYKIEDLQNIIDFK